MGELFAGLTVTSVFAAIAFKLLGHAKRQQDQTKQGKVYRWTAIMAFVGACTAFGSTIQTIIANVAAHVPAPLVVFFGIVCLLTVILDCWGKNNFAGRKTVMAAAIAPILIVAVPVAMFGVSPATLVSEVKSMTADAGVVQSIQPPKHKN